MTKMTISKSIFTLVALGAFMTLLMTIPNTSYAIVDSGIVTDVTGLAFDYGAGGSSAANGGIFVELPFPIGNVGQNNHQSDNLFAFNEGQNLASGGPVDVDILPGGGPGILPDGTYASHYVFYDPGPLETIEGCVTFDSDIAGVITSRDNLIASDGFQDTATTGAVYLSPSARGLESGQDDVAITASDTICLAFKAANPGDYIRVLTEFSPGAEDSVTPAMVEQEIPAGDSFDVDKQVTTGELPANPDIYMLADTTGSMGSVIAQVKADMMDIQMDIKMMEPTAQFGVGEYKDFPFDSFAFRHLQSITDDGMAVDDAADTLFATGGSDGSEGQFFALSEIANNAGTIGWRTDSSRIVVWFGDAPGHDPICDALPIYAGPDITESTVTTDLVNAGIAVIAISTTTGFTDGLNDDPTTSAHNYAPYCDIEGTAGQADRITAATGGSHATGISSSEITQTIIDSLESLNTDVVPDASDCTDFDVTFDPPVQEDVPPNTTVDFTETITVPDGTAPGEYHCIVDFTSGIDGGIIGSQALWITVPISNEPPVAEDDSDMTDEDTSVDVDVLANDSDPDGDALTIVDTTDPANGSIVDNGDGTITYTPNPDYNGPDSFTYTISDGEFESTATVTIDVKPVNDAPVCSDATIDTDSLWPPNHKFKTVTPGIDATDVDGDDLFITILSVFQDEPVDDTGDGKTAPDAVINEDGTVDVRAERSGNENGRVYHITVAASDGELSCEGLVVTVGVPHDKKDTPVDDGANFDSTTS